MINFLEQFKAIVSGDATICINGKKIEIKKDEKVSIINNEVFIDNVKVENQKEFNITESKTVDVKIFGNVKDVSANGSIEVEGDTGNLDAGDYIMINGNVVGVVDAGEDITITGNSEGNIDAGGNVIIHGNSKGDIECGEDVTIKNGFSGATIDAGGNVRIEK